VNDKVGCVRKEMVVVYYMTLHNCFPRGTEKTYDGLVDLLLGIMD
jgi:hypothetical protein